MGKTSKNPRRNTRHVSLNETKSPLVLKQKFTLSSSVPTIKLKYKQNNREEQEEMIVFGDSATNSTEAFCYFRSNLEGFLELGPYNSNQVLHNVPRLLRGTSRVLYRERVQAGDLGTDQGRRDAHEDGLDAVADSLMDSAAYQNFRKYFITMKKPPHLEPREFSARVLMLNNYSKYLKGNANKQAFPLPELKSILFDAMPYSVQVTFHKANQNLGRLSYSELVDYLQTIDSTRSANHSDDTNVASARKPDKRQKNNTKPKKHHSANASDQCPEHPHSNHTWEECRSNPANHKKRSRQDGRRQHQRNGAPRQSFHISNANGQSGKRYKLVSLDGDSDDVNASAVFSLTVDSAGHGTLTQE